MTKSARNAVQMQADRGQWSVESKILLCILN